MAAVLLPLLAFAGGAWWSWRQVEAEARARLARTAQMLEEHALRAFETQETALTAVERAIDGMGWEEIAASRGLHELLRALDRGTAALSGIGLVRPDGWMVAVAAEFPFRPVDVADREYYRANLAGPAGSFVGEVVVSRPREVPVFSLSRARRDPATGAFDGVVVAAFAPGYFSDFYTQVVESQGDAVALLRLDGALLARAPPVPDWNSRAARTGAALTIALAPPGHGLVTTRSVVDGTERLVAVRRLRSYPVAVAYGLDLAVPRAAWLRQSVGLGAVSGLAALLLLGLTWLAQDRARREREALECARAEAERRAEAEAKLREGQRLEVLGQLAAGVAHDFRNTVQAVQGGVRLIRQALDAGDPGQARTVAGMVADAAGRGAALTERMLSVARPRRGGGGAPDAEGGAARLDPARAVAETCELLRRTVGRGVRLRCELARGLPAAVRGEAAELEAALINLVVNARDAMPRGGGAGVLVTAAAEGVVAGARHPAGLAAGRYARIAVVDSGGGMDAATLARATEAFFTTKPRGEGTGLGLSTVRAFAEGAGGALRIESEPGRGTTVTLWLPEVGAAAPGD